MSRTGCLLWILVFVAAGYFAVEIGGIYLRKWQMADEVRTQATFAPSLTDETIERRLLDKVEQLGLPPQARRIAIRRIDQPERIQIRMSYPEVIEFPFFVRIIELTIDIEQSL